MIRILTCFYILALALAFGVAPDFIARPIRTLALAAAFLAMALWAAKAFGAMT